MGLEIGLGARALAFFAVLVFMVQAQAQRRMELLGRGLVAVRTGTGTFLSWRLLGTDPPETAFNVYKGGAKLNAAPLTAATMFTDNSPGSGEYSVRSVVNGAEQAAGSPARAIGGAYLSIPLKTQPGHTPNDASVGDLDGDGEYEIILKQEENPKDNSQAGTTGDTQLEAYKLDGTLMWRIKLGRNIREGAHYTQFMVYDLDGDGRAEIVCKTADGTVDGEGKVIGDPAANYRNADGYILSGPEFLTVFDGLTGKALATTDYVPARGSVASWGDTYGNRVDRFLACIAYLDGVSPSVVMCRGYYTRTVLAAWDWRGGKLTQRWVFDSKVEGSKWEGQGNHGISVADVDEDGKDEIIYGAMAIDDNGKGLWNTGLHHGDAMHVSDLDPSRPGLEIWDIHEGGNQPGADFRNARTGQVYWTLPNLDTGRGMAADITAASPGAELWTNAVGARSPANQPVSISTNSTNFASWWDGDLLRELLNGTQVTKPGGGTLLNATGCSSNNSTKSTPALSADLFGDWREEVMFRCGSNELRIFTTTIPTQYRFATLMHDPVYRLAIAWQNVAYNQPPHLSYFLGAGMGPAPRLHITTAPGGGIPILARSPSLMHQRAPALWIAGGNRALPRGFANAGADLVLRDVAGKWRLTASASGGAPGGSGPGLPNGAYITGIAEGGY